MSAGTKPALVGRSDVWLTPPHVLKALGPFSLDPCAAPAPRPWPTADNHFDVTMGQDGLAMPWHAYGMVFVNPPYSACGPWLEKLSWHRPGGVGLVFARVETDWFFRTAWERGAGMLFLRGRLRFCTPDGRTTRSGVAPSVLIGYGEEALRRLARAPLKGHLVVAAATVLVSADGAPVGTWQEAVAAALAGRTLRLSDIYAAAEGTAKVREAKASGHNWRAQVRRALQVYFRPIEPAVWSAA